MSDQDREKWDKLYQQGAYAQRSNPAQYLSEKLRDIKHWLGVQDPQDHSALRCLDVACGAGRNSIYLAQNGFAVDAVDISQYAIQRGRDTAKTLGVPVQWHCGDLFARSFINAFLAERRFHLVVIMRFAPGELMRALYDALYPGGVLLVETHMQVPPQLLWQAEGGQNRSQVDANLGDNGLGKSALAASLGGRIIGPKSDRFRIAPGYLHQTLVDDFGMLGLHREEGLVREPDDDPKWAAVSRILVAKDHAI